MIVDKVWKLTNTVRVGLDAWSSHAQRQSTFPDDVCSYCQTFGPQECTDPFVCRQTTVAPRFATPLHCRHSEVFNDLLLDWSPVFTLWLNPSWHLLSQVLEKVRVSRARGTLIYPFCPLQPWFQRVYRISTTHYILPPPHLCVRPHHPVIVEPFVNREVQLRAVVFDCA